MILFAIFLTAYYFSSLELSIKHLTLALLALLATHALSTPLQILITLAVKRYFPAATLTPMSLTIIPFLLGLFPLYGFIKRKATLVGRDVSKSSSFDLSKVNVKYLILGSVGLFISIAALTFPHLKGDKTVPKDFSL